MSVRFRHIALLMPLVVVAASARAADTTLDDWINSFYHSHALCANSSVDNTVVDNSHLRVDLLIDERWAASMESFDQEATDRWFAIHCPLPFESVAGILGERDIIINTHSIGDSPRSMSCRAFSESISRKRQEDKTAARSRLRSLLDRLGLSG